MWALNHTLGGGATKLGNAKLFPSGGAGIKMTGYHLTITISARSFKITCGVNLMEKEFSMHILSLHFESRVREN